MRNLADNNLFGGLRVNLSKVTIRKKGQMFGLSDRWMLIMQVESNSENSYRSFLNYFQSALGGHLSVVQFVVK